jgi:hypothetical protein
MSLNLIKKNSSSPFHLQRSMVDQGGSGGAYESGGFNPDMVYNNDAANAAIMSFGKIVGAGLTATDKDKEKGKPNKLAKPNSEANPNADIATWEDQKSKEAVKEQTKEDRALFADKYNASKKINKR